MQQLWGAPVSSFRLFQGDPVQFGSVTVFRNEKSAQRGSFWPDVPADIRPKTSVRPSKSWKNKHFGTDMPRGRPRKNFGLKNFGLIFRSLGLGVEQFKRFRFSVPAAPLQKVFFCCSFPVFQYSLTGKDGSGSGFGSLKMVPAVPVPLSVSGKTVLTVPVSGSGSVLELPCSLHPLQK